MQDRVAVYVHVQLDLDVHYAREGQTLRRESLDHFFDFLAALRRLRDVHDILLPVAFRRDTPSIQVQSAKGANPNLPST